MATAPQPAAWGPCAGLRLRRLCGAVATPGPQGQRATLRVAPKEDHEPTEEGNMIGTRTRFASVLPAGNDCELLPATSRLCARTASTSTCTSSPSLIQREDPDHVSRTEMVDRPRRFNIHRAVGTWNSSPPGVGHQFDRRRSGRGGLVLQFFTVSLLQALCAYTGKASPRNPRTQGMRDRDWLLGEPSYADQYCGSSVA